MFVYVGVAEEYGDKIYTVGHYRPDGSWVSHSDYSTQNDAARLVNYLNGGTGAPFDLSTD